MNIISFITVTTATLLFSFSAFAFDWNIVEGDQRLSGEQVKQMVFGKKVIFKGIGKEYYNFDGSYKFVETSGKTHVAKSYSFSKDGIRCIIYEGNFRRCDLYVKHKRKLYLIDSRGDRFKVKVK